MAGNLILVEAESQHMLASTFLRFQEHYESPRFRGAMFDLEEFMDWYAQENGAFTYYEDWTGFNIPSRVLEPFRKGKFNPLSRKEQKLLDLLRDIPLPFYVIGIRKHSSSLDIIKHELAHGLFYTNAAYRTDILRGIRKHRRTYGRITPILKKMGYHPTVWRDEAHAYLLTGANSLREEGLHWSNGMDSLASHLREIFHDHFGFDPRHARRERIMSFLHRISLN